MTAIVCLLSFQAMAQADGDSTATSLTAPQTYRWTLGAVGGLARNHHVIDMSYQNELKYDDYTNGYTAGVRASFQFFPWIALRADVVLIQKNYNFVHAVNTPNYSFSVNTATKNSYLNVPLMIDLSVGRKVKVHGMAGGYAGYWLKSHRSGVSYPITDVNTDKTFDEDVPFNEVRDNRFDAGFVWGAGVSAEISRFELEVDVRWYYGVTDIQKNYMRHLNPRYNTTLVFQGGISYKL